jgi:hypothetical protein
MIRYITLLTATLLLTVSCSGGSDTETAQVATSVPTATVAPPTATATPGPTLEPDNLENKQITADQHDWEYIGFEVLSKHPKLNCLNKTMDVFIDVFGVWVISTKSAPENYVLHTANVLAEFIDNDSDGIPDDVDVLKYLVEDNYVVPVWTTSERSDFWQKARGTYCVDNISMAASMYYDEDQWALGGIKKKGTWDTNLEEVWHVVTRGWSGTYPEAFSVEKPSLLTDAMDVARGGYFEKVPSKYPPEAWYKYYDESCKYECQASEYIYWALMANIGALDPELTGKCADSADEWNICTTDDLGYKDILISELLNNMGFKLPTRIPDGSYR